MRGTNRVCPPQRNEPKQEHKRKDSPEPVGCMSGNVCITGWRVGAEGIVASRVDELEGHGEEMGMA